MRTLSIITLTSLVCLVGCGGSSETAQENNIQPEPPVTVAPVELQNTVSLAGMSGQDKPVKQQVEGQALTKSAVVKTSFANAQGTIRSATGSAAVVGNLTLGVTAQDPDGIKQLSLYLPKINRSFILCTDSCLENSEITVTGLNPQLSGEQSGDLRIELIVKDSQDNETLADTLSVNWQPIIIPSLSAVRENGTISLTWGAANSAQRYNIYAATDADLTRANVLELDNGVQFLSQTATNIQLTDQDENKPYYVIVTAINNGGESGMTAPIVIPSQFVEVNLPPIARVDSFQVNEDESLSGNVLINDEDPEGGELTVELAATPPTQGELELNASGEFTYTPRENFFGNDSFRYIISDEQGLEGEALVTLTVNSVNDLPVALNDVYTLSANNNIAVSSPGILSNDSDIDGDTLVVEPTPITAPEFGSLNLNDNGSFTYVANSNFDLSDSFEYQISDGQGGTHSATVTILSSAEFAAPIANNDSYQTNEDITLVVNTTINGILGNDQEPNGFEFQLDDTLITEPQHGQLNLSLDGTFTYIPESNYVGVDQFQYQITSTTGKTAQATVSINILSQPDAPLANDDNYQLEEDQILFVDAEQGLLINDSDPDGGSIAVDPVVVNLPSQGVVVLHDDGSFEYTPVANFNGVDSFTYQIMNESQLTSQAQVTLTVSAKNDAPLALDDFASTDQGVSVTIDVLANDVDLDGGQLTIESATVDTGTVSIVDKKLVYQPEENYSGVANITYTIAEPDGLTATANVIVAVNTTIEINNDPIAVNDSFSLNEDTVFDGQSVLANDSDEDNDVLTVQTTPVNDVSHGALTLFSDGSFVYTPASNFNGDDSFTYSISDGQGGFDQASVSLVINAINDLPNAVDDTLSVFENSAIEGINVLLNDSDVDNDTLTLATTPVSDVANGTLNLNSNGDISYSPRPTFNGADSFIYEVNDGQGGTAKAGVNINIISTNVAPIASNDSFEMDENAILSGSSVLLNDKDEDNDKLTVTTTPVNNVSNGILSLKEDGTFVYTPSLNFDGTDSFVYEVKDPEGATSQATVSINVLNSIVSPIAFDDSYTIITVLGIGDKLKGNVLDNDFEPEGGDLKVTETPITNVKYGELSKLDKNGSFEYTPNFGFLGTDSFVYEIYDDENPSAGKSTATVTIAVISL
ncbi:Ig-like domain-containing protein [Thalassotalea castellviae]|uniref:Ig-like domain-containing protein n=1 Tax=Thalassotalea castellviae TaxID=3075612 RepID=A0ABU2ZX53_9GAMM|nr:Ig-like domain-containing protein [Thalassotalea sp. W431]MDT0602496.1 Ig-like domain-containing protein [Thalassotalea sp. W431]